MDVGKGLAVCWSTNKKKRKMNDVSKAILYVVAKRKRKMMMSDVWEEEMSKHHLIDDKMKLSTDNIKNEFRKKSSITKTKRNEGMILSKNNKRNNLGKGKTKENHDTTPSIGDTVNLSDLLFTKNKKRRSSGCVSYLPEELIFNILSRTCVTSLLRCKSVCKLWQSIISKPEFMNAHHVNSLDRIPSIMMITSRRDDDQGLCSATIVYPQHDSVNIPLMPPFHDLEFVSSFNGVVCVFNYVYGDIYLLNPLTRISNKLLIPPAAATLTRQIGPQPPQPRLLFPAVAAPPPLNNPPPPAVIVNPPPSLKHKVDVGFGFDCLSHDFKVLWSEYRGTHTNKLRDVAAVNLYSSNSDSWRVIKVGIDLPSLLYYPFCPVLRSGPVVDGVLYMEGVNVIITFDLHTELFGLISYPSFLHTRKSNVLDFEGSVAVVLESIPDGSLDEKELSLWTLVAVSDEVVWNKTFTFGSGSEEIDWVFLYSGENQFFGKTRLGEMLYDYRKKQTKYVGFPSQSFLVRVLNHTESFLSVKGFEGFEGVKDS